MKAVLFDFNGTLFFDTCFHLEAWSRIYKELRGETDQVPGPEFYCGPCNDTIIQAMAPDMTPEERQECSAHKEAVYRELCLTNPEKTRLTAGAEQLFSELKNRNIPFTIASASILDNVEFYFHTFYLERWFDKSFCVYDDGTYKDKGEMHIEAAKRLGVSLSECIVIEDSVFAVSHAKQKGAGKIIGIGNDSAHPELIRSGAAHCIRDFTEFNFEWLS